MARYIVARPTISDCDAPEFCYTGAVWQIAAQLVIKYVTVDVKHMLQ